MSRLEHFQAATGALGEDTPMEHYGVEVVPAWRERDLRKFHDGEPASNTVTVPIDKVKAGQNTVDHSKVVEYAKKPITGTCIGKQLPGNEGVMLEDGHHRLAAARLRGDTHLKVQLRWKHGARYPGTEGRM